MIRALACVVALTAPLPALALSCIAPTVEQSYAQYDHAADTFVVVHGRLTLDVTEVPKGMRAGTLPPALTLVDARLKGASLTAAGFTSPFDQALTLEVHCLSQWCGSARNGEDILAFVRKDAQGYVLEVSPCGGTFFGTPKPGLLKRVQQCLTQGGCTLAR